MQPLRRPVPSLLNEELTHATIVRLDNLLQCGCCRVWRQSDSPHVGPSPTSTPTVSSVTVRAPSNRTIFIGNRVQFTAQSTLRDGTTQNVTTSGTWGSGNPSVARVNQNGMVTAVAAGNANIFVDVNPRGSFRIRVFPQFGGSWIGSWFVVSCRGTGFVVSAVCRPSAFGSGTFPINASMFNQSSAFVAATLAFGGLTGTTSGTIAVGGLL